jgi:small conductance mechanosensitive channel
MRLFLFVLVCARSDRHPAHAQTGGGQPDGIIAVDSDATQDAAIAVRIREIIGQLDGYEATCRSSWPTGS